MARYLKTSLLLQYYPRSFNTEGNNYNTATRLLFHHAVNAGLMILS